MGIGRFVIGLMTVPHVALADLPALTCAAQDAAWELTIEQEFATFAFLDRTTQMQIMQRSTAENATWPLAMTAVGPRDSAIMIVEQPDDGSYLVRILTQRGETPVLLAGTCKGAS